MMAKRRAFWLLFILAFLATFLGLYLWLEGRSARALRLAETARPALTGAPQAIAPDFALATLEGNEIRLSDLRGKVALLNFWATWCPPCAAEMPDLDALYRQYGDAQDFVVVGINVQEDPATVEAFARDRGLSFPIALDPDGAAIAAYGIRPLPTTLIIDREGFIRDAWNGQLDRAAMLARLTRVW